MMDDFEKQLAEALKREEPSGNFEARVLAAVAREKDRRWWWMPGGFRWAAALAMLVVVAAVGVEKYREAAAERAAGEAAKARLELALKITSAKLTKIRQQVNAAEQDQ
jgi:hypothetical protein